MTQQVANEEQGTSNQVPYKTIIATIGLVVIAYLSWLTIKQVVHIIELIVAAAFFAIALNPAVDFLQHKAKMRRSMAATVVFITGACALLLLIYVFVHPLVNQTLDFIDHFPQMVQDAQNGKGTLGELVVRYDVDTWVEKNQDQIRDYITSSTGSVVDIASTVAATVVGVLTVLVLSFMMLLEGPQMLRGMVALFKPQRQERIKRLSRDGARAVSGYVTGNLLISFIAGMVTFATLSLTGVPFAVVLAVWVAFSDLIPLVGATLGAIPTISIAFLHSTEAGIVAFVVYVIYQQIENHILQPTIMAKTVKMNPLMVLISVLLGVQLAGLLGALFAIPAAAVIQVIARDLINERNRKAGSNVEINESGEYGRA